MNIALDLLIKRIWMSKLKDFKEKTGIKKLLEQAIEQVLKLIHETSVHFEPSCEQFVTVCHISTLQDTLANWNKGGYSAKSIAIRPNSDECIILFDRGRKDG